MLNPSQQKIIDAVAISVKALFTNEGTGHDWWHIHRVWKTATKIAE
jgi:uncharacterized protein